MKKLAIVILLGAASCGRQVNVSSTPGSDPGGTGASGPREAVQMFLATAKAQDIQAMAGIWGSKDGPARSTMAKEQLEPRIIYMMRCLRHDSYSILSEKQATEGERVYSVEMRKGTLTPRADFIATPGPKNRWYLRQIPNLEALNSICVSK